MAFLSTRGQGQSTNDLQHGKEIYDLWAQLRLKRQASGFNNNIGKVATWNGCLGS